ncbi:helix-turn-helix domain-containing protein [Pedobacter hartonius]|uniref:Helix-turn-helix domain-containing protein n=1 Tax=Pedobacter hartonius TaxID=425514 RepID=A0A1H4CM92_9SPHI|nr:AraC family transcriptional regulator [Pedobacter hartonius]SEA61464.1 Helix-turn-helix domain-containing protein [Pedobacter hartonius]
METHESLRDFYHTRLIESPPQLDAVFSHYDIFRLEENGFSSSRPAKYCRRDFFKIAVVRGHNRCHYEDKTFESHGSALMFFSPHIPYTWEPLSDETGYFCIFKESFYNEGFKGNINNLLMFAPGGKPIYGLNEAQDARVSAVFENMLEEKQSDYQFKLDLSRNYLSELIHIALKLEPAEQSLNSGNGNERLALVFSELLYRQFDMEGIKNNALLKTPKDYADRLCVHVNHLNRALKETTGKTTSNLISDKIIGEAQHFLKSTNDNISQIANTLGFEDLSHFSVFFKKRTGLSPSAFRDLTC